MSEGSPIPPSQKMVSAFIAAVTIRLEKINDEVVKASKAEVVALFNPLRGGVQIEDKLNINHDDRL